MSTLNGSQQSQLLSHLGSLCVPLSLTLIALVLLTPSYASCQSHMQASEPLATFLDFLTYGHMIDNVVLIVTGTLHERDMQVRSAEPARVVLAGEAKRNFFCIL